MKKEGENFYENSVLAIFPANLYNLSISKDLIPSKIISKSAGVKCTNEGVVAC